MNDQNIDFSVDQNNLYREESITDLKVAAIRKLIPIKPDGQDDPDREVIFVGHTQLMSPEGPLPLQARLEAGNMEEAMKAFPGEMQKAMADMQERVRQYQQQQQQDESRIITPGR
ncbi:MAG: cytoplasmic protein [Thermodesulfobacteriota bacterium]|nr:cytoplasmic protein [Thermodesulfobacteriota bacterium]